MDDPAERTDMASQPFPPDEGATESLFRGGSSRREFLRSSAGLIAGGAAAQMLPSTAPESAQTPDDELTNLRAQRRILLRGGIVLTLDRAVGDFAQADVLIENGKIAEV